MSHRAGSTSIQIGERAGGLFSPADMLGMMRAEFDRGQRHGYPLVAMVIAVDRLGQLHDLYGAEAREEIVNALLDVLRNEIRDSDWLCLLQDDRLLSIFPHTAPESGAFLARRLLAAVKKQRFDRDGRTLRISLSIGISHNRHEHAISFETLVAVAEEGMRVADSAGGDRFVETELYQLFEKKRRAAELEREREALFGGLIAVAPSAPMPSAAGPSKKQLLGETVIDILSDLGITIGDAHQVDRQSLARAIARLRDQGAGQPPRDTHESQRTIDVLERRIAKLTHELGVTEEELRRIAALKSVDLGVASVYRSVQGLSGGSADAERKREMMREIFTANFALKKELSARA